jgi:hypothetical protein
LAGPPDSYDGTDSFQFGGASPYEQGHDGVEWGASHGDIDLVFDGTGRVFEATIYPGHAVSLDPWSFVFERLTRGAWKRSKARWKNWWTWG